LPLQPALAWIVKWFRAFQAGDNLRDFTCSQIERYEGLLKN
jgi:CDP-glucose 4,6-dehydratase